MRTSSEESMAGEDDRTRKPNSLYAPTPLIRTSSGTHVRPKPRPRSSRHSGWLLHFASMSLNTPIYIAFSNKSKIILLITYFMPSKSISGYLFKKWYFAEDEKTIFCGVKPVFLVVLVFLFREIYYFRLYLLNLPKMV